MGSVFGGAPKVQSTAPAEVAEESDRSKKLRTALLETEGGVLGEEVQNVKKRDTLLGN